MPIRRVFNGCLWWYTLSVSVYPKRLCFTLVFASWFQLTDALKLLLVGMSQLLEVLFFFFTVSGFHCGCSLIVFLLYRIFFFVCRGGTVFKSFSFLIFWNCTAKYVSRHELVLIDLVWDLFFLYLRIHIFHHSKNHLGCYPMYPISLIVSIFDFWNAN